jgi:hypothetical protein
LVRFQELVGRLIRLAILQFRLTCLEPRYDMFLFIIMIKHAGNLWIVIVNIENLNALDLITCENYNTIISGVICTIVLNLWCVIMNFQVPFDCVYAAARIRFALFC